jgi:hypothetical protein
MIGEVSNAGKLPGKRDLIFTKIMQNNELLMRFV